MNMFLRCLVVGLLLLSGNALAVNYTLPSATFAPCQGGAGNWNQATNTCSGQISFASGDTLTSSSALTLSADGGFALRGNTIGTASNPITLQASYNQITTIAPHSATTINGNVRNGSAAITLTNVTINGFIETASGSVTLTNSSVTSNVTGTGNGSLSNTNVGGNVSFTNGLSVTGGTLSGSASTNGNASFTNTTVIGAATATNGITASNSNFSGTITATNGVSSFSGGTINANINGNCCKITVSGAYVTGNISSSNELEINNSTITGTVSSSHRVNFSNSTVCGNVTAASWHTITGTGSSKVYGTCSPSVTTPSDLCDGSPISSCPIGQQIDHFEFSYAGQALTCNPQPVTVKACLNASCSSLYTDPVSVTLSPATGWSAVAPATLSGGNVLNFSGGTAAVRLQRTTVGNLSIGVSNSSPATKPLSVPVCSTANCTISYAESGFLLDVPNMLAAKPTEASITAVRKADNAALCVPAFANVTRTIGFTAAYVDPSSGIQPVVVNGSNISAAASNLSLSFDGNGRAPLTVRYNDAGQRSLSASYSGSAGTGDSGLLLNGTDLFVSKPYGLCLQTASSLAANTNCNDASCAVFPGGIRAGDNFPLTIRAVGWEADGEALTAAQLCSGNITTPNFRLNGIRLESAVVAPNGGENGVVAPATYNHALGSATIADRSVSEVGVFTITATPPANGYLDNETVSGGTSALVGRFIPAFLSAEGNASLTSSCGSAFSYQGQPMEFANNRQPTLTITAKNRTDGVTTNYDRGDFWKLAAPDVGTYSSITASAARDARLVMQLKQTGVPAVRQVVGAGDGDGSRTYRWTGQQLLYQPANAPSSDDYPFAAQIRQTFTAASLREVDQLQEVCYGTGAGCQSFSYDFTVDAANNLGSQIRLGRLRLGNAHGPELQGLGLPLVLESWQDVAGGSFQPEGLDNCTTAASLGAAQLDQFSGNLAAGETTASLSWPVDPDERQVLLSAPGAGNDGSAQVSFPAAPSWLHYPWDGANRTAARGLATFGIYKGAAPLIFRREVYR